jgi:hypothetical protein
MVKAPVGGRVKTRLMRQAGLACSVGFYRQATAALLARIGRDPRWQTVLAVAPDRAVAATAWPLQLPRIGQGGGDLGVRMQRICDWMPPGPVVIVGSDIPGIGTEMIARAFRLLGRYDAVFGPATDGGFWLVGLRRRPRVPRAFAGVRWSTPYTLADNRAALGGCTIAEVATLDDIDTFADLERAGADAGRRVLTIDNCEVKSLAHAPDNVIAMS